MSRCAFVAAWTRLRERGWVWFQHAVWAWSRLGNCWRGWRVVTGGWQQAAGVCDVESLGAACRAAGTAPVRGERYLGANRARWGEWSTETGRVKLASQAKARSVKRTPPGTQASAVPFPCQGPVLWRRRPERREGPLGKSAYWSRTLARSGGSGPGRVWRRASELLRLGRTD